MASKKAIMWTERLVWMLIYGGLFTAVIGFASRERDPATGWSLMVVGGIVAAIGALLVWIRSRMKPDA